MRFLYIFCSPDRVDEIKSLASGVTDRFLVIGFNNIWDSLSHVQNCDFVIGMDSCVKTMANILKIPSLVFAGDYIDQYRDEFFIKQYVRDGHMQVMKFKNIENISQEEIISKILI